MTLVNSATSTGRAGVPTAESTPRLTQTGRQLGQADAFDGASKGRTTDIPTAKGATVQISPGTAAVQADVINHTVNGLNAVRTAMATPGVMSHADAKANVIAIYSAAFPGVGFTERDLAAAIKMLETGKTTPAEMKARVEEGARLINDPNAMAAEAARYVANYYHESLDFVTVNRPDFCSVATQQLRAEKLSTLMQQGYIPEGKFNIVGGLCLEKLEWSGRNLELLTDQSAGLSAEELAALEREAAIADMHDRGAPLSRGALSADMAKSLDRYRSASKNNDQADGRNGEGEDKKQPKRGHQLTRSQSLGGPMLINGAATNSSAAASTSNSFGGGNNFAVSMSSASASSLSQLSSHLDSVGKKSGSPVMLDLNHDGRLGVTGNTSAKERIDNFVHDTVDFDLDGNGSKERIEWMNGDGDGMLVDDRDGGATAAANGSGEIDGKRLFGDEGGKYASGYDKLEAFDKNHDGVLTGHELDGLKSWIDDGDAKVETGELKTVAELGISSINLKMELTANDRGEQLMRSTFTQNGVEHVSEDVWFGIQHGTPNLEATAARVAEGASEHERSHMVQRLDSTLALLDSVARDVEQRHSTARLTGQAQALLVNQGFRA